jgi:oligosaccharide repeat unit polymerase
VRPCRGSEDGKALAVGGKPSALPPIVALAVPLAAAAFAFPDTILHPIFLVVGYPVLLWAAVATVRSTRDPFNPFTVLLVLAAVRFLLPAALYDSVSSSVATPTLEFMGLTSAEMSTAHLLILVMLLATGFGWLLGMNRFRASRGTLHPVPGRSDLAVTAVIIGAASLVLFVASNADLVAVVVSGGFRGTAIQEGTGFLYYLSFAMLAGVAVLTEFRAERRISTIALIAPALVVGLLYFVLGGRARMITPVAVALLILWYRHGMHQWRPSLRWIRRVALGAGVAVWLFYVGAMYRAGRLTTQVAFSLSDFYHYLSAAIVEDVGQLHGLAGAIKVGASTVGPWYAIYPFLWPFNTWVSLPAGDVDRLDGIMKFRSPDRSWGFHSGVPGDLYLAFGVAGVVAGGILVGLALALCYRRFRAGRIPFAIYALFLVYGIRVFFEGLGKWSELLTVVAMALALIAFTNLRRPHTPPPAVPEQPAPAGAPTPARTQVP